MIESDTAFTGSIPALYDRCLGPLLFEPYAKDLAERSAALAPRRILETAAGTGIVTAALVRALPDAEIVATDLNPDMLAVAAAKVSSPMVSFQAADAGHLPFPDGAFDLVLCQFGTMFFPDRVAAFTEARRVLKRGGLFLFNVWDRIDRNLLSKVTADAVAGLMPDGGESFIARVPFGYHDPARIERELVAAGFDDIAIETVEKTSSASDPATAAHGICAGSPLALELEARGIAVADAERAVAEALARQTGEGGLDLPMSALVVGARA
jgi:ubiquinone/menaquinone biosynthesis C-methylase UbiE